MKGCMKNPTGQQVSRNDRNNVYVFRVILGDRACILRMDFGAPMTPDAQQPEPLENKIYEILYRHEGDLSDGYGYYGGEKDVLLISKEIADLIRTRPHTPAPELYKMQTDEDGAIGKVAVCLCDSCKVNGFLCEKSSRAISPHPPAPEQHFECDSCGEYIFEYPCQYCGWIERGINIKEHDATTARAATLKTLTDLATFLDNADNISDSGNANKFVPLPKLFKWIMERGGSHD